MELTILKEAVEVVEKYGLQRRPAVVVWGENWHQGVVGIVASRLVELYYRPTVVISLVNGEGVASARSIAGLHLFAALSDCAHLLTKFGGHAMAAGLTLPRENLREFQGLFEEICAARLSPEDYLPKLYIDGRTQLGEVTEELVNQLSMLEPHGLGNPGPLLQTEVAVLRTQRVGAENQHLKLWVHDATANEVPAIAFGFGEDAGELERRAEGIALAFVPTINAWQGTRSVQLQVRAWQEAPSADSYVRRWLVENYPSVSYTHLYDADGQTATALLVRALRRLAHAPESITYYLPDRLEAVSYTHLDVYKRQVLECSYEMVRRRKQVTWGVNRYRRQLWLLAHAKAHADLVVRTDGFSPEQLVSFVHRHLVELGMGGQEHGS